MGKHPSWCGGTCPLSANCLWANITTWRNFDEGLDTQAVPHLANHPLPDQRCSCTMETCTPRTANTKDLLQREAVEVLDWPSRSSDLNLIVNLLCFIKRYSNDPNTIFRYVADLRFEVHRMWNGIPRALTRHFIHSCRRRVCNLLAARGDFIGN